MPKRPYSTRALNALALADATAAQVLNHLGVTAATVRDTWRRITGTEL